MKLVLSYIDAGYEYTADVNVPFEYESVEKAELDLYEKWEEWRRQMDEYEEYESNHPRPTYTTKNASEELEKWVTDPQKPKYPNPNLTLGNIKELSASMLTTYTEIPCGNGPRKTSREKYVRKREYDAPKIRTLDQWWTDELQQ